jgi:hypothetical protein
MSELSVGAVPQSHAVQEVKSSSLAEKGKSLLGKACRNIAHSLGLDLLKNYAVKNSLPLTVAIASGTAGFMMAGFVGAAVSLALTVAVLKIGKDLMGLASQVHARGQASKTKNDNGKAESAEPLLASQAGIKPANHSGTGTPVRSA